MDGGRDDGWTQVFCPKRAGGAAMIMSLAVFAQLAATCSPDVAVETLTAIARTESGLDPVAMLDNTTGRTYRPENQAEAVRIAAGLIAAGHSIDAGLMGINSSNWRWLGLSPETVFDPCQNIRAGAAVLTAFSRYNTGSPTRGFRNGYVQKVIAKLHPIDPPLQQPAGRPQRVPSPTPAPMPQGNGWNAFDQAPQGKTWNAFPVTRGEYQ
jgi:type IV secretion system protein VirB1